MGISSAPDSLPRWTSREIEDRLGISALKVEKSVLGAREIAAIREAGIARIEVYLHPLQCDYHDPTHVSETRLDARSKAFRSFLRMAPAFLLVQKMKRRGGPR